MRNIFTYKEHLREAIAPNFVIKGDILGTTEEPRDYLMDVDGDVFSKPTHIGGVRRYQKKDFYAIKKYNTDFSRADFRDVEMQRSFFKSCNFNEADLTGANANGTRFERCTFIGAKGIDGLEGAQFNDCTF